jgi:hypothetical protein
VFEHAPHSPLLRKKVSVKYELLSAREWSRSRIEKKLLLA